MLRWHLPLIPFLEFLRIPTVGSLPFLQQGLRGKGEEIPSPGPLGIPRVAIIPFLETLGTLSVPIIVFLESLGHVLLSGNAGFSRPG